MSDRPEGIHSGFLFGSLSATPLRSTEQRTSRVAPAQNDPPSPHLMLEAKPETG